MLSSRTSRSQLVLILDVQSSVVHGALVSLNSHAVPEVIFTYDAIISVKTDAPNDYLIKTALKAVTETVDMTLRYLEAARKIKDNHLPKNISLVHYVLSSPWALAQAKTCHVTFPKSTVITKSYIQNLIEKESAVLTVGGKDQYAVVENKVADVRLNGYSIAAWEKKEATDLTVSFIVSIAGKRMSELFIESCAAAVSRKHVHFHSSLVLQQIAISSVMPSLSSYTLIDIHGELTDVTVVSEHCCVFFASFSIGSDTVIRTIARETKTDTHAAESVVNLYMSQALSETGTESRSRVAATAGENWAAELKKVIASSGYAEHVPRPVVVPDVAHADYFMSCFRSVYPDATVEKLSIDELLGFVSFGRDAGRTYHIGLDALAINTLQIANS